MVPSAPCAAAEFVVLLHRIADCLGSQIAKGTGSRVCECAFRPGWDDRAGAPRPLPSPSFPVLPGYDSHQAGVQVFDGPDTAVRGSPHAPLRRGFHVEINESTRSRGFEARRRPCLRSWVVKPVSPLRPRSSPPAIDPDAPDQIDRGNHTPAHAKRSWKVHI